MCCAEKPVTSQVIKVKSISNEKKASHQELIDASKPSFIRPIRQYNQANQDAQPSMHAKYDAWQFKDTFKHVSKNYLPNFGFVVVQKRINTRILPW